MKIFQTTRISASIETVKENFNQKLFEYLNPPGAKVDILRFDGTKKDDVLILNLKTPLLQTKWQGRIIERQETSNEFYFIDIGEILPMGLKTWHHKHLVTKINEDSCLLIDDVNFTAKSKVAGLILYPMFWSMFFWRRHRYQRFFQVVVNSKK